MTIDEILEEQLEKSSADLVRRIGQALGVRGKSAIMQLVKTDPEARRLIQKIFKGQATTTASEPVIDAAPRPRASGGAAKDVEF